MNAPLEYARSLMNRIQVQMKSFNTTFRNGHFYDEATNKRIIPINGKQYLIAADHDAFCQHDELMPDKKPYLDDQKMISIKEKYKGNIIKLLNKNSALYFRLGLGGPAINEQSLQYVFECVINDDLYIYLPRGAEKTNPISWRLLDCSCHLTKSIIGGLALSEEVTAKSLNQLFQHTVMFYFSMQRSGSCNPFKTFFILPDSLSPDTITINKIYAHEFTYLDNLRSKKVHSIGDSLFF